MELKDLEKKLNIARTRLCLDHKFFGSISASLEHEINEARTARHKTACTNGKAIYYHPEFIAKLSAGELVGLIAHEVAHVALEHHLRIESRDHQKWNRACDYAVNYLLKEAGFDLPEGGLYDPNLGQLSSESIYGIIPDQPEDKNGKGKAGSSGNTPAEGWGEVESPQNEDGTPLSTEQKNQLAKELRQTIASAEAVAKMAGELPAGVARLLGLARKPSIPWTEILRSKVVSLARDDYSYRRPSRRSAGEIILPTLRSERPPKVAVFIDTSGSVGEDDLATAMAEIGEASAITALPVVIAGVDTEFGGWNSWEDGDPFPKIEGGGGTDFRTAFQHLEDEEASDCQLAIFITDGYTSHWGTPPDHVEVVWVITPANHSIKPPFGEAIHVDYPNK